MKIIKYMLFQGRINHGTEEEPNWEDILLEKKLAYSEYAEEIAKIEAWGGAYEIYDDGTPEPTSEPSQLDRVESQVAYLAMMSGYPEILEV